MWHNYRALNKLSLGLIFVCLVFLLHAIFKVSINSDLFMVKRINFVGDINHVSRDQFNSVVIKNVEIKRNWPNAIDVLVSERDAMARWKPGGLLDDSGELFNGAEDKRLPILDGPIGQHEVVAAQYLSLTQLLEPYEVSIDQLRLTTQRSWLGQLSNGTVVALGEKSIASRLERFIRFLPESQSRYKSLKFADLRYANGFSVSSSVNGKDGS